MEFKLIKWKISIQMKYFCAKILFLVSLDDLAETLKKKSFYLKNLVSSRGDKLRILEK